MKIRNQVGICITLFIGSLALLTSCEKCHVCSKETGTVANGQVPVIDEQHLCTRANFGQEVKRLEDDGYTCVEGK